MQIFDEEEIDSIISTINKGEIIAVPTDTIYGLICRFSDNNAISKLFSIKQRDQKKRFAVLVKNWKQASEIGFFTQSLIEKIKNNYDRGQVTVIVKIKPQAQVNSYWETSSTVALRVTNSALIKKIISAVGPIIATSCNVTNQEPINNILQLTDLQINFAVSAKNVGSGYASVIYDSINQKVIRG